MRTRREQKVRAVSHRERRASRDGYFAPESVIRRVGDTPVTALLGGGTAVLLQVAHPLVAAGVADHSSYDKDVWRRLVRTLRALYLITYGSKAEAEGAAAAVRAAHARVNGTTREQLGAFPPGTAYSAEDPDLMLWVHATLVHSSLCAYQRFERELSRAEEESYYREMAIVAELFGTPPDVIPATLTDLREYFSAQLAGSTITVTEPARQIARAIYRSPLRGPMRVRHPGAQARHHGAAPTPPARGVRPPPGTAARAAADRSRSLDEARQPPDPARREPHPAAQQHRGRLTRRDGHIRCGASMPSRSSPVASVRAVTPQSASRLARVAASTSSRSTGQAS